MSTMTSATTPADQTTAPVDPPAARGTGTRATRILGVATDRRR